LITIQNKLIIEWWRKMGFNRNLKKSWLLDGDWKFSVTNNKIWKRGHVICFLKAFVKLYMWWLKATKNFIANEEKNVLMNDKKRLLVASNWNFLITISMATEMF
jgi:hypothetical protein